MRSSKFDLRIWFQVELDEGETLALTVVISDAEEIKWFCDEELVEEEDGIKIISAGDLHMLTIGMYT